MATTSQEPPCDSHTDRDPLLMERPQDLENHEQIVDIVMGFDASSTSSLNSTSPLGLGQPHNESRLSSGSTQDPLSHSSSPSNSGVSSTMRGHEAGHQPWSPFKCSLWFLVEFVFTMAQIIASVVALALSRHENPKAPLFAWVVGYAAGCAASLPIIYWRCLYRNQGVDQNLNQSRRGSPEGNSMLEANPYITISLNPSSEEEAHQDTSRETPIRQPTGTPNARFNGLMEHFKMALDCFFAVWFVVGNVWIFGGHAASSEAPNLYRLCIVFLTISCVGYALPFILCAIICCCLPCIISFLGREDLNQMRGATAESINALPAYKFKLKRISSGSDGEENSVIEGGFVGAGTEKERVISGEDAVCCICLARYVDNDDLRELPCSHFFHTECVDKWLKINATCPLCKSEVGVGESNGDLLPGESSPQRS